MVISVVGELLLGGLFSLVEIILRNQNERVLRPHAHMHTSHTSLWRSLGPLRLISNVIGSDRARICWSRAPRRRMCATLPTQIGTMMGGGVCST